MKKSKVILYGPLRQFGREFEFVASNARQVISALCNLRPGFKQFLARAHARGVQFAVFVGDRNISKDQLDDPAGGDVIRIAPVIMGTKRAGTLQTIIGVVLVVVGIVINVYTGGTAGTPLIKFGAAMAIGGICQMLAPVPKGSSASDDADNRTSYLFNGPKNTQAQGVPVPYVAGEGWCGSAVISAGIYAENQQ